MKGKRNQFIGAHGGGQALAILLINTGANPRMTRNMNAIRPVAAASIISILLSSCATTPAVSDPQSRSAVVSLYSQGEIIERYDLASDGYHASSVVLPESAQAQQAVGGRHVDFYLVRAGVTDRGVRRYNYTVIKSDPKGEKGEIKHDGSAYILAGESFEVAVPESRFGRYRVEVSADSRAVSLEEMSYVPPPPPRKVHRVRR